MLQTAGRLSVTIIPDILVMKFLRITLALFTGAFILASCGPLNSGNTLKLLSDAGFTRNVPETAKQKQLYAAAEPYKIQSITSGGKTLYAYKDEKSGTAYVGTEKNYQEYRRLAQKQEATREQYEATHMQSPGSWYGPSPYSPYRSIAPNRYP